MNVSIASGIAHDICRCGKKVNETPEPNGTAASIDCKPQSGGIRLAHTEDVATSEAPVVIEDAFVDDFAELGAGHTSGGASDAGCDQRTNKTAEHRAWWTSDGADRHASSRAGQHACGSADGAADKTNSTACTAGSIARDNALGTTVWTDLLHDTPLMVGSVGEVQTAFGAIYSPVARE